MARNPCSYLPRRLQILVSLTAFVALCVYLLGTSSDIQVPYFKQIGKATHQVTARLPDLPHRLQPPAWINPIRAPAHAPPEQLNSTSEDSKWFSDWRWQSPFSSSTTLDDERVVLPPLPNRQPIYTYYDPAGVGRDEKGKKAEAELLKIWRRAWWAQGFKPVVLGPPEAMNNPMYRTLLGLELDDEMESELKRWLAWGNMGTGILANWLAMPMAAHDDPLLAFLRRGEYPKLTRFEGLENGLYVGEQSAIDNIVKIALSSAAIKSVKSIVEAVPKDTFIVDPRHDGVAFYSRPTIVQKYALLREKLEDPSTIPDALALLPQLINAHLHIIWQGTFTSGIAVLKPHPLRTTHLVAPAVGIARNLSQCPESPIPASCPPNKPRCKQCVSSQPMLLTTPTVFRNTTTLFTIGTIPHPYTLTSLLHATDALTLSKIRRTTKRDQWILKATEELLGTGASSTSRLPDIKDAIASAYGSAHSLWFTAERPPDMDSGKDLEELDWVFGFALPREEENRGRSVTPVPGPERRPQPPKADGPVPTDLELEGEKALLVKAQLSVRNDVQAVRPLRAIVEAWNLADTEAWRFAGAFAARQRLERRRWEEDEEEFSGRRMFGRWFDAR